MRFSSARSRTLAIGLVVAFFSWLGLASGIPRIWSPAPMATVVPVLWAGRVLVGNGVGYWFMRYAMPQLVGFALFVLWSPQLLRGSAVVPWRSTVGLVLLTVLDGAALAAGWAYGLEYQGFVHTAALVTLNSMAAILCWAAFVRAYRHATFPNSLLFHASTAVWIVWLAFPWLGELL